MTLTGIRMGDIVLVDHKGRRFYAHAAGHPHRGRLPVRPCDARINYFSCSAREVIGIWRATKTTRERQVVVTA